MKCKYQCPYCQYMSLKKFNVERHVNYVHRIKNFPNGSIQRANIDHQNMSQQEFHNKTEYPIHSSEYRSIQQHQQTFDDEQKSRNDLIPSVGSIKMKSIYPCPCCGIYSFPEQQQTLKQEQKSRNDLIPSVCACKACKEREPFIVYDEETYYCLQ